MLPIRSHLFSPNLLQASDQQTRTTTAEPSLVPVTNNLLGLHGGASSRDEVLGSSGMSGSFQPWDSGDHGKVWVGCSAQRPRTGMGQCQRGGRCFLNRDDRDGCFEQDATP